MHLMHRLSSVRAAFIFLSPPPFRVLIMWQKVQKCWVGGITKGRFGEVKWGLSQQLWGMMAYLGQRALWHKQLGSPTLVCVSRRVASRYQISHQTQASRAPFIWTEEGTSWKMSRYWREVVPQEGDVCATRVRGHWTCLVNTMAFQCGSASGGEKEGATDPYWGKEFTFLNCGCKWNST